MVTTSLTIQLITISIIILQREYMHQMISSRTQWSDKYDYIVIGSGSAGAVVAMRSTEDPNINVLLLEAGGPQSMTTDIPGLGVSSVGSVYDWKYKTVPQESIGLAYIGGRLSEPRGKVIGGTSTINGMLYNRGNRRDFNDWAKTYGAKGWSYNKVLPYFTKSENNSDSRIVRENPGYHGTSGPVGVSSPRYIDPIHTFYLKAINRLGLKTIDVNGAKQLGVAILQSTIEDGIRCSTGNAYIDPNPHPKNLHILTNAFVTKILFNKSSHGVSSKGVEFFKNGLKHIVNVNKEVILSAGAISSPQILMLSGIGPKRHLNDMKIPLIADLPVGDHLKDHPAVIILSIVKNQSHVNTAPQLCPQQLYELYVNKSGPLSQFLASLVFFSTKNNAVRNWPNTAILTTIIKFSNNLVETVSQYESRIGEWNDYHKPFLGLNVLVSLAFLGKVRSYGSIRLSSKDPFEHPLIDPKFLSNPRDLESLVEATKFIIFVLQNTSFSDYIKMIPKPIPGCSFCPERPLYKCDSYIICHIRQVGMPIYHPAGSCRMGSIRRSDVVVDERLRVKNVKGLRVIDASIMPNLINGNPNAASIMIGEYGSQMIKEDQLL